MYRGVELSFHLLIYGSLHRALSHFPIETTLSVFLVLRLLCVHYTGCLGQLLACNS